MNREDACQVLYPDKGAGACVLLIQGSKRSKLEKDVSKDRDSLI